MTHEKQRRFMAENNLYFNPEQENYGCFGFLSFNACNSQDVGQTFSQLAYSSDNVTGGESPYNLQGKIKQSLKKKQNSSSKRYSKLQEKKSQLTNNLQLPQTKSERQLNNNIHNIRYSMPYRGNTSQNIYLKPTYEINMTTQKAHPNLTPAYRKSQPINQVRKLMQPNIYYTPKAYTGLNKNLIAKKSDDIPQFKKDLQNLSSTESTQLALDRLSKKIQSQQIESSQKLIQSKTIAQEIKLPAKKAGNFDDFKIRRVDSIKDHESEIEASIVLSKWHQKSADGNYSLLDNLSRGFPSFSKQLLGTKH